MTCLVTEVPQIITVVSLVSLELLSSPTFLVNAHTIVRPSTYRETDEYSSSRPELTAQLTSKCNMLIK